MFASAFITQVLGSKMSKYLNIEISSFRNSLACSGDSISGSVTTSTRGIPDRL